MVSKLQRTFSGIGLVRTERGAKAPATRPLAVAAHRSEHFERVLSPKPPWADEPRLGAAESLQRLRSAREHAGPGENSAFAAVDAYLRAASPGAASAFLEGLGRALATRPTAARNLAGFLVEATRVLEPIGYLKDVAVLSGLPELSDEALRQLGVKAASGQVDPGWLLDGRLRPEVLDFMGRDPFTPWHGLRRAAELPDAKRRRWQSLILPGIAGEYVAKRWLNQELAPYRVVDRQLKLEGVRADFFIESPDQRLSHAVEVKTWTEARWRRCLAAFPLDGAPAGVRDAEPLVHLVNQLRALYAATGVAPVLAIQEVSPELREALTLAVVRAAPKTLVVSLPAAEISEALEHLRAAF